MQLETNAPLLILQAGEVVALNDAAGTRVQTRCGTVWVTEENDPKDHIVGPGDSFVLARGGRTVIQALQSAWISLQ